MLRSNRHKPVHPDCANCQYEESCRQAIGGSHAQAAVAAVQPELHGVDYMNDLMGLSDVVESSTSESWRRRQGFAKRIQSMELTSEQRALFDRDIISTDEVALRRAKSFLKQIAAGIPEASLPLLLALQQSRQIPARRFCAITSESADQKYSRTLVNFTQFVKGQRLATTVTATHQHFPPATATTTITTTITAAASITTATTITQHPTPLVTTNNNINTTVPR
jgi:hypothetical protein